MGDMKEYSGPYRNELGFEDLSKEALIELLHGYGEELNLLSVAYSTAIAKRFGQEAMRDITAEAWCKMAAIEMDTPRKALKIEGNDVETYCKLNQFGGSFPNGRDFYQRAFEMIDRNHAILTVHDCFVCRMYEKRGLLEEWDWNCKVLEKQGMLAYTAHVNPKIQVRELRAGRKTSPDEPACRWEFWIDDADQ
ncbi:MAG: hypothetical protein H6Q33_3471 [Deltaproteobacteria bacterium]|nr:hypothetical protein [Deltaproteobacteria bacterium]